ARDRDVRHAHEHAGQPAARARADAADVVDVQLTEHDVVAEIDHDAVRPAGPGGHSENLEAADRDVARALEVEPLGAGAGPAIELRAARVARLKRHPGLRRTAAAQADDDAAVGIAGGAGAGVDAVFHDDRVAGIHEVRRP